MILLLLRSLQAFIFCIENHLQFLRSFLIIAISFLIIAHFSNQFIVQYSTVHSVHIFLNQNNNNNIILQYLKEFIAGIAGIQFLQSFLIIAHLSNQFIVQYSTVHSVHMLMNQNNNNNIILQYLKEFIAGIAGIDRIYYMMVYDTNNGSCDQARHLGRLLCFCSV